jgi:hypothetical protein
LVGREVVDDFEERIAVLLEGLGELVEGGQIVCVLAEEGKCHGGVYLIDRELVRHLAMESVGTGIHIPLGRSDLDLVGIQEDEITI